MYNYLYNWFFFLIKQLNHREIGTNTTTTCPITTVEMATNTPPTCVLTTAEMGTQTPTELPEPSAMESGDNQSMVEDNWEEAWFTTSDMDGDTIAAVRI